DPLILTVDEAAEIAAAHRFGPNRRRSGTGLPQPVLFPRGKEESSILAVVHLGHVDRTAERCAEFVAYQVRRLGERVLPLPGDAKSAIAASEEDRAVRRIGSASRHHDGAGGPGELGARDRGFDSEFLDRVESRRPRLDRARIAVLQIDAVLHQVHRGIAQSVDLRLACAAFQTGDRDAQQSLNASAIQGELFDTLPLDYRHDGRAGGGEQRRYVAGHGDLLGRPRDIQRGVDDGTLARDQGDATLPLLHPGEVYAEPVRPRWKRREYIESDFAARSLRLGFGPKIHQRDRCLGYDRTRGIGDRTLNLTHARLCEDWHEKLCHRTK